MQCCWIVWSIFYVIGAVFKGIQTDRQNSTQVSTSFNADDYDSNYPDYVDRDYLSFDYYDDRGGRSLNGEDNNTPHGDVTYVSRKQQDEDFMMKQLQSTIPGTPGVDYALYQSVPDTSFQCGDQQYPGFYGDVEAQCQVFHICQEDHREDSFLCPVGTVFNQISFICDWWFNFNCEDTPMYYHLNDKFHASTGRTSMRDTMQRMKNFQDKKSMGMIMGLAKVHKKLHNIQNMRKDDPGKHLKTPKPRNLFMLGMRRNTIERIRSQLTFKRSTDDNTTPSTLPTPLPLRAASSTGYVDIALTEYTATTNNSNDDLNTGKLLSVSESATNVTEPFNATEVLPHTTGFNAPFTSVLNLSSIEMVINGSISSTVKLDRVEEAHIESTTVAEYASTQMYKVNKTEEKVILMNGEKSNENEEPIENRSVSEPQNEKFSYTATDVSVENKTVSSPTAPNESSPIVSSTITFVGPAQEPTNPPLSKPFSHENNFIIGNDTHISVSVTIHSKSGRSKLHWKRLPGIKRIRKFRFKTKEENTTTQNSNSDTTYKRRINDQKPRSRIMWIPAKKNALERKMDWKTFLESKNYGTITSAQMDPIQSQPLKALEKAAFENGSDLSINISDNMYYTSENNTINNNQESAMDAIATEIPPEDATTIHTHEEKDMEFSFQEATTESSESISKVENSSNSESESFKELEDKTNLGKNQSEVSTDNCRTICIKLLRSLHENSSRDYPNSVNFEKAPSSLTLFNYDSSDNQTNSTYGRKGVLGVSPSEQWTVKYDPGPNCNENTEDDKVLIKGWSVIIDTGSVTKEKTVKKRGCAHNLDNSRVLVMRNSYDKSRDRGITFNSETPNNSLNSQNFGSTDQRYWLNLVRNWLEQSPNINEELTKRDRNTSPNQQWRDVESHNSLKVRHQDSLQQRHNPKRQNSYNSQQNNLHRSNFSRDKTNSGHISQKFNAKNLARNFKDAELFPKNNEKPRKFTIRNTKPDWHSDLQTERSDWFQATQETNDWNNKGINSKGSNIGSMRDWVSEQKNMGKNPMINLNKGTRDGRARTRQDTYLPASQDYDDWSSKKPSDETWNDSGRNSDWQAGSDKSDWSEETWQNQDSWDSMPSRSRSGWDSRRDDWSSKGNKRTTEPNKNSWPKSNRPPTDWSDEGRNKGSGKKGDTLWKKDTKPNNRRMRSKGFQDGFPSTSKNDQGTWPSMKGTKGRSVSDEWNWAPEKSYDINIRSMSDDRRDDWSSMNSRDIDKQLPRRDDWGSRMLDLSPSKPTEDDWSSDDRDSWGRNSDSLWNMDRERKDKGRRNMAGGDKGNIPRTDWNSEENKWKDEEQRKFNSDDWNRENPRDMIGSSKGSRRDWNSQTNKKQDWSSGSRGGRKKGFAVQSKESSDWSSENSPGRGMDEKRDRDWSSKASSGGSSQFPNRSSRRSNAKGGPNVGSKRPDSVPKSWSSNRNDWGANEQTWMTGNARRNSQKGDPNPQKPANNPGWKSAVPDSQEWFSEEENTSEDVFRDKSWDLPKGTAGSRRNPPKNDNEWATRKKMEPDSRSNRTPISKGARGDGRSFSGSDSWKKDDSFSKGTDSWTDKNPKDSKPKGIKGNSPHSGSSKGTGSWGSTKGNSKGSMRQPQPSSSKGTARNKQTMPWNTDENSPKTVNNDKGDAGMKKIVWSVQISSDGKTGNGWVPITLRPDLQARKNGTESDWNNKGSPPEEDWSVEDMKKADWNSELSQYSETTPAETNDDATETSSSTSQMTEASFSQLFYIPAFRSRYKREYTNNNGKNLQARNSAGTSYKVIKSGEVLNDVSKDNNKFFLATANILVGDRQRDNQHPSLKKVVGQETVQMSHSSNSPVTNNNLRNFNSHAHDVKYWDAFPKESVIRERWSSPFHFNNFSASGWIPVTTPKPSTSGRNLTNLYSFIHRRNDKVTSVNNSYDKTEESAFHTQDTILEQFTQKNASRDFPSFSHSKTFDILSHNNESKNAQNGTGIKHDRDSEIGTEMKVGNKTLRILSFSDVMKQLRNEDDQFEDSHNSDPREMPWNLPITTDPITYSLKLINTSKETPQNASNSWIFASNGNSTKHAWILMGSYNTTKQSSSDKTVNIGDINRNLHSEKIETYNMTTSENINKLFNSTLHPDEKESTSNSTFYFKPTNWNSDSDWRPVIRTIGRVVSYNRTLLLTKESSMK